MTDKERMSSTAATGKTPRTDAFTEKYGYEDYGHTRKDYPEWSDFARQLERELAECEALRKAAWGECQRMKASPSAIGMLAGPYSYEYQSRGLGYRVRDKDDNRVATCFDEGNAQMVVAALNASAPRPETLTPDWEEELRALLAGCGRSEDTDDAVERARAFLLKHRASRAEVGATKGEPK